MEFSTYDATQHNSVAFYCNINIHSLRILSCYVVEV